MTVHIEDVWFVELADTWLQEWASVRLKDSGLREYEAICRRWLIPAFGDLALGEITFEEIQRFVARQVESGLAPRTVANQIGVLSRIFDYACSCGLVDENPTKKVVVPCLDRQEMHFLTAEQLHQLICATPLSWRPLIAMAALTGIRKGEQLALTFSDVDLERRTVTIAKSMRTGVVTSPKTKSSVSQIPLPESLLPLIEHRRKQVSAPNGLIFCRTGGSPLSDGTPNRQLARALAAANLPSIRWHDLRHSWAVAHIQAGTDMRTLAALGRWSSPQTLLDTYAHVIGIGGDAVKRFDEFMSTKDDE